MFNVRPQQCSAFAIDAVVCRMGRYTAVYRYIKSGIDRRSILSKSVWAAEIYDNTNPNANRETLTWTKQIQFQTPSDAFRRFQNSNSDSEFLNSNLDFKSDFFRLLSNVQLRTTFGSCKKLELEFDCRGQQRRTWCHPESQVVRDPNSSRAKHRTQCRAHQYRGSTQCQLCIFFLIWRPNGEVKWIIWQMRNVWSSVWSSVWSRLQTGFDQHNRSLDDLHRLQFAQRTRFRSSAPYVLMCHRGGRPNSSGKLFR